MMSNHLTSTDIVALLSAGTSHPPSPSLSASLLHARANTNALDAALLAGLGSSSSLGVAPAPAPDTSTQAALISLLLQKQQREEQERAFIIRQLAALASTPVPLAQTTSSITNNQASLARLLQQKSQEDALVGQAITTTAPHANPMSALSLLSSASSALLGPSATSPSSLIGGASSTTSAGELDALALAKILQAQQRPVGGAAGAPSPLSSSGISSSSLPSSNSTAPAEFPSHPTTSAASLITATSNNSGSNSSLMEASAAATAASTASPTATTTATTLTLSAEGRRKGRTGTFPQKLHQMLSDLERQEGGTDIASFLPHGRSFAIHKPRDFVKFVMTKYFRMSRFSSFQRQLNLYDFQRVTEGSEKGSYYHELFVQFRPVLSTMMKRNKIKGVKNKNGLGKDAKKSGAATSACSSSLPAKHDVDSVDESEHGS